MSSAREEAVEASTPQTRNSPLFPPMAELLQYMAIFHLEILMCGTQLVHLEILYPPYTFFPLTTMKASRVSATYWQGWVGINHCLVKQEYVPLLVCEADLSLFNIARIKQTVFSAS